MIEVKDVVKTFDGFRALDGVTMTVPRGAVYGLVGPNGAAKPARMIEQKHILYTTKSALRKNLQCVGERNWRIWH